MNKTLYAAPIACALLVPATAGAHVSVAGPAFANTTWEANFNVGHGCEGHDTYSVKVEIPAGVTSVRPIDSVFGKAFVTRDQAGAVTTITWTKEQIDVLPQDDNYYRLSARMRLPNTPFAKVFFPTTQVCRDAVGAETIVEWIGTGAEPIPTDGAAPPEPAPAVTLLPARVPGWNKYTVATAVSDLGLFSDAEIVWSGDAAYSVNPNLAALIGVEPGTTALTTILAGSEIWVKY